MNAALSQWIFWSGAAQLCVLAASALVPLRLEWRRTLAPLPTLVRQLFWVYGGYVVLSIIALGTICLTCSDELAQGSTLARAFCGYAAVFWGIRLCLQPVFDARPFLTSIWLEVGYHLLTFLFASFTLLLGWAALR